MSAAAKFIVSLTIAIVTAASFAVAAAQSQSALVISQKDRRFAPDRVTLAPGDHLKILNDDRFVHHVYFKAGAREFDSGDQRPGETIDLAFPGEGVFTVNCAIHPKMKLTVAVGEAAEAEAAAGEIALPDWLQDAQ